MSKTMGVKYLTGEGLAKRIRKVMAGDNPWMCVAFLGPTWTEELFDDGVPPEDLRVVCDLALLQNSDRRGFTSRIHAVRRVA